MKSTSREFRYCKIYNKETEHIAGNYKTIKRGPESFECVSSLADNLKEHSRKFTEYIRDEKEGKANRNILYEFMSVENAQDDDASIAIHKNIYMWNRL